MPIGATNHPNHTIQILGEPSTNIFFISTHHFCFYQLVLEVDKQDNHFLCNVSNGLLFDEMNCNEQQNNFFRPGNWSCGSIHFSLFYSEVEYRDYSVRLHLLVALAFDIYVHEEATLVVVGSAFVFRDLKNSSF